MKKELSTNNIEREDFTNDRNSLTGKVKDTLKYHLVDSTAILTESTPAFAAYETFIAGMSPEISMNTRLIASASAYAGLGYLYGKGRDISRKIFKITDKTNERIQQLHDSFYTGAFNSVVGPLFYLTAGETDAKKIAIGTACGIALGAVNGGPMGYAVDLFRDLTGLKESERIPELVRKQNSKIKKGLVALLVGSAIALTSAIYSAKSNQQTAQHYQQSTQQIIDENK